ncbi:hypothetical protein SDC9_189968 [bioreactor metagenome]|uniref:Uncharacterized protein n=1 Tax=bioreactor metagenome TaxID=1076179 RepID=A0A645HTP2_9ZZZZ
MAAESTGGSFTIKSRPGVGTKVNAAFVRDHIDREPLGDMGETLASLIGCNPDVSFLYEHTWDNAVFRLSTQEVKNILKDIPLNTPEIILWIKEFINEQIYILYGGASV